MPRFDTEMKATPAAEAEDVPQRNIPDVWDENLGYEDLLHYIPTDERIHRSLGF